MAIQRYHLGCPEWGNKQWTKDFFAPASKSADFLRQYASVFNTVEGNTTFYGIPRRETVKRWSEQVNKDFRFCFKFPRAISHDKCLVEAERETNDFLGVMEFLGTNLGPFFLQMPPSFGSAGMEVLEQYLAGLPDRFDYALELRHPDFFDQGVVEEALEDMLIDLGIERVLFDASALHASTAQDEDTRVAKRRKPKLPVRNAVIDRQPFVRFIGDIDLDSNQAKLVEWADRSAEWIKDGKHPYIFIHTPNDFRAPWLARSFHTLLQSRLNGIGPLPIFPSEAPVQNEEQLRLF